MLTKEHFDCEIVLNEILSGINHYYKLLRHGDYDTINREFESVLFRINQWCRYKSGDEIFEGAIRGVNEIGQLIIQKTNGEIDEFHFKEVEFLFD